MTNPPSLPPKPEPTSTPVYTISGSQSTQTNVSQLVSLCAAGLLGCFFLPWMEILFSKPTGFDFAKAGEQYYLFWLLPFFCIVTIISGITKSPQRVAAQLTGCLPFVILAYGFHQVGQDLMKSLAVGAYVGLGLGLALIVLPRDLK